MSEPRDTVVLPCRHLCLCKDCAELLRSQGRQLPATATVGQVPNVAVQNAATPTQIAETPPAQPSLISTIFNPAPVGSTARTVLGAPKCPICRQVFHSLLQINLPAPAVGIDRSAGSSTRINIS